MELYDRIGHGYRALRRPDPRIADRILAALEGTRSIVNVGAGVGSYEPHDRAVVAVEPSMVMIRQRGPDAAPTVRASATALPFDDDTFDASLAVLTLHHWPDRERGIEQLRRTARDRVVILTWEFAAGAFWIHDYFPEIAEMDRPIFPSMSDLRRQLGQIRVVDVPIPHDCTDGFLGAYWRRPAAYLEAGVRAAISCFAKLADPTPGLARLRGDLGSGRWQRRYGHLLERSELDLGYRLVVA